MNVNGIMELNVIFMRNMKDCSEPMNIGLKHLKLTDNCVLVDWDVSLLYNLESIEITSDC